jgi:hypothetical protein
MNYIHMLTWHKVTAAHRYTQPDQQPARKHTTQYTTIYNQHTNPNSDSQNTESAQPTKQAKEANTTTMQSTAMALAATHTQVHAPPLKHTKFTITMHHWIVLLLPKHQPEAGLQFSGGAGGPGFHKKPKQNQKTTSHTKILTHMPTSLEKTIKWKRVSQLPLSTYPTERIPSCTRAKTLYWQGVVEHACISSIQEAEVGESRV